MDFASFYLNDHIPIDPKAKFLKPEIGGPLRALAVGLAGLDGNFSEAAIQSVFEKPSSVCKRGGEVMCHGWPGVTESIRVF